MQQNDNSLVPMQGQHGNAAAVTRDELPMLSSTEIRRRKDTITRVMRECMLEGQHYGKIPGTDSPALFKSGAEMIGMTFRLIPHFDVTSRELGNGHREYSVQCTLTAQDGTTAGMGMGLCSSMESKYRWRWSGRRCPKCGVEAIRQGRQGSWYCHAKSGGCGDSFRKGEARIEQQQIRRVENPDIADQMNTVLKMAVKRAHVAAILFATGASDMFVQEEEAPPPPAERKSGDEAPAEPAPAPSEQQELARECAQLATQLGMEREALAEMLKSRGAWAPTKSWTELSLGELRKAQEVLASEVAK